jgi:hypothetical protein
LLKLPVAIIGPSTSAGLKATPRESPARDDIESDGHADRQRRKIAGAAGDCRVEHDGDQKKASTASIRKPAKGVIVTLVTPRAWLCASAGVPRPVADDRCCTGADQNEREGADQFCNELGSNSLEQRYSPDWRPSQLPSASRLSWHEASRLLCTRQHGDVAIAHRVHRSLLCQGATNTPIFNPG